MTRSCVRKVPALSRSSSISRSVIGSPDSTKSCSLPPIYYEIVFPRRSGWPSEVVEDLPMAELGQVLFHRGSFWRVDAIELSESRTAQSRLLVSLTTEAPKPTAA